MARPAIQFPLATLLLALIVQTAAAQTPTTSAPALSEQNVQAIARDAYVYAYPIVLMDVTRRQVTNVPDATSVPMRAPVNQFAHFRSYPDANAKDVVRFNFDTLYSFAWLDLSREPIVLSLPDTSGRYYLVPMLDMWTDVFAVPGSRTTQGKAGNFAIVPPGWSGNLPNGVERIAAPTPTVWVMGRTQTNGPADYANVHKVQDSYKLTPLSAWGQAYAPPQRVATDPSIDDKTPPLEQVNRMDGITMLTRLAGLLKSHPPHPNDYPILYRMRQIGIEPGRDFDASKLDPAIVRAINNAAKDALADLVSSVPKQVTPVNGWNTGTENIGTYGTSYKRRAVIALAGLGANLPEDAIYPTAFTDAAGQPLTGSNNYVIRFEKGQLPPADAFWSITMYDKSGFQVPNPINRFAIGDRDKLAFNTDGSLDIYVQAESPGPDKESNWLPAPKGAPFEPSMRIYSPRREALDGTWSPPPIRRVEGATTGQSPR